MKVLKFRHNLVPLVLTGQKNSTWRLFDDKNLSPGDEIELQEFGLPNPFAEAVITKVTEKRFGDLTEKDKSGHELYQSDEEMYQTYTEYYRTPVTPDTFVKIVWFNLTNFTSREDRLRVHSYMDGYDTQSVSDEIDI